MTKGSFIRECFKLQVADYKFKIRVNNRHAHALFNAAPVDPLDHTECVGREDSLLVRNRAWEKDPAKSVRGVGGPKDLLSPAGTDNGRVMGLATNLRECERTIYDNKLVVIPDIPVIHGLADKRDLSFRLMMFIDTRLQVPCGGLLIPAREKQQEVTPPYGAGVLFV